MKKRSWLADVLLIACVLLVAALGAVYLFFFKPAGDTVTVTMDGKVCAVYSLSQDGWYVITSGEGQQNVLVIQDGKASVVSATCPDGICAAHKPIHREGESIVCLPNKVVITVQTTHTDDGLDAVV